MTSGLRLKGLMKFIELEELKKNKQIGREMTLSIGEKSDIRFKLF